jgi:hypothetical protein
MKSLKTPFFRNELYKLLMQLQYCGVMFLIDSSLFVKMPLPYQSVDS